MTDLLKALAELSSEQHQLLNLIFGAEGLDAWQLPIPPRSRNLQSIPLSFAQQRLWFLNELEPGDPAYVISTCVEIEGELNVEHLGACFNQIIARHEALRTTFSTVEGQPVQMIHPTLDLRLPLIDLRQMPQTAEGRRQQRRQVEAAAREEAQQGFDLRSGPLLRARLLVLGEKSYVLLLSMHHIVSDGWSIGVLIREMGELYEAQRRGRPAQLPELAVQYGDYAVWQRAWLTPERLLRLVSYWREELAGAPAEIELPVDRGRAGAPSRRGGTEEVWLGETIKQGLEELGRQEGATLYMVLMAAYKVLLMRYSGQADIVVGTPIANRNRREVEGLIGFFVNTLVMRTRMEEGWSFRELLRKEKEVALGAYEHQELPFEKLVEELRPERTLSDSPLFQTVFVLQNGDTEELKLEGLKLTTRPVSNGTSKFDLMLIVVETQNDLIGMMEYRTDLFDGSTIRWILETLKSLLEEVASNPDVNLLDIPIKNESAVETANYHSNFWSFYQSDEFTF